MRRQAGDSLPPLQERVNRPERLAYDLLYAHEAAPNPLLGELEDRRLGIT